MDISKYDKAKVLCALYNNANAVGYGQMEFKSQDMQIYEAQRHLDLKEDKYFDYLFGRYMKVNLSTDELDTHLYNENNGENAAENAIDRFMLLNR